jgi:hypothetical protein
MPSDSQPNSRPFHKILPRRGALLEEREDGAVAEVVLPDYTGEIPVRLFAIITWGCAATSWIARALNSHPEIFCLHGGIQLWAQASRTPPVHSLDYLDFLRREGHYYLAAGDIHGVSISHVAVLKKVYGSNVVCPVVVREPMARLRSQMAMYRNQAHLATWDLAGLDEKIAELDLPDDQYITKLFVHGASMLNSIIQEWGLDGIFRSEDLTSEREKFASFVRFVSHGRVEISDGWLEHVERARPVNAHRARAGMSVVEFEPWQVRVIRKIVQPAAWERYSELGYPVPSFV